MRERLALHTAAGVVTALILAPLAAPGYVLSYDMVFVPAQPLLPELIAPVDAAPRAVPLDAAVSLASTVIPGWLLQRLILAGVIWAAVVGAGRLVPSASILTRVFAGVAYGWTPFVAERLLIGQWGLLIAYAALPWLVLACQGVRERREGAWPRLILTAGLSALTPTGGLIAAVVCVALTRRPAAAALLTLLNSPWIVAGLLGNAASTSDPASVAAFAARSENWGGPLLALLSTGGIWNSETTPASRASALVPLVTLCLLLFAFYGYRSKSREIKVSLVIVALAGLLLAALSTIHIGTSEWLIGNVPGAGLLRDSQKFVLPFALLLVVCASLGVERLAARLPTEAGRVLTVGVLLIVVGSMPDLAFGGAGALRPVRYPADWDKVAVIVHTDPGEVLSFPLSEYRGYDWNRDRTVIDPAPRYLPAPVLTDDRLIVDGRVIDGENQRLREIRDLPLAETGVRWILMQHPIMPIEQFDGLELVFAGPHLSLYRNPAVAVSKRDIRPHLPIIAAELTVLAVLAGALVAAGSWRLRRWRRKT